MDRFAEAGFCALQLEIVVVSHQGVTVQPYPEPFGKLLSNWMNFPLQTRRAEYRSPLGSAIQNIIPFSWESTRLREL
jgi:hypothetical protein